MTTPVVLTVPTGSFLLEAVGVLDRVVADLGPYATVGGIAVITRVAQVHRATADIDSAVQDLGKAASAIIAAVGGSRHGNTIELDDNAGQVDLVDASVSVADALAFEPDDSTEARYRARAVLMRVATETADLVPLVLCVPDGEVVLEAELRIARPGVLAAAKALSARDPSRNEDKRGTDVVDLVMLTEAYPMAVLVDDLAAVPPVIRAFHALDILTLTVDEIDFTMRWLHRSSRVDSAGFPRERVAAAAVLARQLVR